MRESADDRRRQEGDQNAENEAPRAGIAGEIGEDFKKFRRIDRQNGQNGAELDQHLEGLSCGFKAKKVPD